MSNRSSRSKSSRQHRSLGHFRACGAGTFRGSGMHVEAIRTLRGTRYRDRNEFAILPRNGSVFAADNLVESYKRGELLRRKFFELSQYFQIVRIVIMHIATPVDIKSRAG